MVSEVRTSNLVYCDKSRGHILMSKYIDKKINFTFLNFMSTVKEILPTESK